MNEKQRLLTMLHDGKISETDFKILSDALDKKPSGISAVILFLINPFQKIAGIYALLIGLAIILIFSFICVYERFYVFGIMNVARTVQDAKIPISFTLLVYQNVVSCLIISLLFIIMAKLFRKKNLRLLDFFSMVAVARVPFLIQLSTYMLMQWIAPSFVPSFIHPTLAGSIYFLLMYVTVLWQYAMYFYALKEASGLTGNKWIYAACISIVLASVLIEKITMLPVY